ncbi:hypothetical protein LINGRAPRIM_LOCUS1348 [Linum grandiflorum]
MLLSGCHARRRFETDRVQHFLLCLTNRR